MGGSRFAWRLHLPVQVPARIHALDGPHRQGRAHDVQRYKRRELGGADYWRGRAQSPPPRRVAGERRLGSRPQCALRRRRPRPVRGGCVPSESRRDAGRFGHRTGARQRQSPLPPAHAGRVRARRYLQEQRRAVLVSDQRKPRRHHPEHYRAGPDHGKQRLPRVRRRAE